ncbi:uncharacterized protein LOC111285328 isoform X2 [Durio zibethinus]|uniref:Uncharacterized protein LOC111285328 isoform X2 n=1 Tax=Durio zibethinus TaxID=66656 RepID=A0A6P5XQW0_DURZI|nr:uncharacterized protein LOC111285328 isoform X2 [Durio zibethinus]
MIEKTKKQKKGSISEEDISTILQRYTATTILALLQEVAQFPGVKLNWNALVKKTSTGISNAREYQMLWHHLAYRDALLEKLEDGAEPLVLIASGLPSDSSRANSSTVEASLRINVPNVQSFRVSSENSQHTCSMQGTNITVPVSVQKQILPAVTSAETLEGSGSAGVNQSSRRKRKPWSEAEDMELIAAVQKCGVGNWANILRGDFKGNRTAAQLAQRWTIIKKRLVNLNVEGNSTIPQLSEAQLATRSALSLALDMPDKNLTAACTNNPGLKPSSSNPALPTTSGEASVQAQNQSQQGPITSVSTHNQPQKGPITYVPAQNLSQQGPVASVQVPNQSQQGPMTTKTSPRGPSASTLKSRVSLKKPPAKSFPCTGSILDATAVAAGARIGSPEAAAFLLKAAQSKNAIHIMASGGSSVKPLMPGGTSSHLEVHSNVQYVSTGLTAEPVSSPVVSSSTLHPGSVKSATYRVEHTPASSSLLNASTQQCNAVTSGPTVEGPLKEEIEAALEIKGSVSDSLPKEQVQENGACVSKNEPGEGVKEHKAAASNPNEFKDLEAVAEHPNGTLMVESDQVDVTANLVEESQTGNDSKIDYSLVKKSDNQPAAEESSRNQSMIKSPAEASLNDGSTKNLEVLSKAETGQAK